MQRTLWLVIAIAACGNSRERAGSDAAPTADASSADASGSEDAPPDAAVVMTCPPIDDAPPPARACTTDPDCVAAHEVCLPTGQCGCASGYGADPGGICTWRGVVTNPGFSRACGWTLSGLTEDGVYDVYLAPDKPGMVDPGEAGFAAGTDTDPHNCPTMPLGFSQTISMPRRSRAEPLVIDMTFQRDPLTMPPLEPTVQIGAASHASFVANDSLLWTHQRVCLGAADFAPETSTGRGVAVTFTLSITNPNLCLFDSAIAVDHVEIVPAHAGECP